jgi:hypothetical protein
LRTIQGVSLNIDNLSGIKADFVKCDVVHMTKQSGTEISFFRPAKRFSSSKKHNAKQAIPNPSKSIQNSLLRFSKSFLGPSLPVLSSPLLLFSSPTRQCSVSNPSGECCYPFAATYSVRVSPIMISFTASYILCTILPGFLFRSWLHEIHRQPQSYPRICCSALQ